MFLDFIHVVQITSCVMMLSRILRRSFSVQVIQGEQQLSAVLASSTEQLVVVDWTASWCGPCKMIAPVFQSLAEKHPQVVFVKVDVDEHMEAAQRAGVSAMPTFQFIKNQQVVQQFAGADAQKLTKLVEELK